jgi:hypothetical protein
MADVIEFNGKKASAEPEVNSEQARIAEQARMDRCAEAARDITQGLSNAGMPPNEISMVGLIMTGSIAGFIPDDAQREAFLQAGSLTLRSFAESARKRVLTIQRDAGERAKQFMSNVKKEVTNDA